MTFSPIAAQICADGPISMPTQLYKPDIRAWGTKIENIIDAFITNGGLVYQTKAAILADLAHPASTSAWVISDSIAANNGIHQKQGAAGAGTWTRIADLPYSFIVATDLGAGTPNAIQATSTIPISASALVVVIVFEANTASALTI